MIFEYIDTYDREMSIKTTDKKQMGAIAGKMFKRKSWSGSLAFALDIPTDGSAPYFAYCTEKGIFKEKTGNRFSLKDNRYSTVGESVLESTDIIEIKRGEKMVETINVVGGTITISECAETNVVHKTPLESRSKWIGVWYAPNGHKMKELPYESKKDIVAELKEHPQRTVVLYKVEKVLTVDFPIIETEA